MQHKLREFFKHPPIVCAFDATQNEANKPMNFRLEPIRPKKVRKKHEGKNKVQVYAGVNQKTCKTAESTRKLPDCATKQAKHKQTSESPTTEFVSGKNSISPY